MGRFGLDPSRVAYEWHPYLSTSFAADRELEADLEYIHTLIIRFEQGSAKLPLGEAHRIEDLAAAIGRITKVRSAVRVAITGHTDEIGGDEVNVKLSVDRAVSVSQALAAEGIPPSLFSVTGVGNSLPLRTGGGEWDKATNRSVSFRVDPGPAPGR